MPDRISNGKLLNMSPGARADTIAGLSCAARDTLANIATLGAARCIRRGMKRVKSPRSVVQAHRDFIDAADLCDLAAELTKRETGESTELYGAVERNCWDDRTTPDAYGKSDAAREIALRAERDEARAARDEAQAWAELIGQAVVGILGIHEDEVPDQMELLRLAQAAVPRQVETVEQLNALPDGCLIEASGRYAYADGGFTRCWARPIPAYITGDIGDEPRPFEVLVWGPSLSGLANVTNSALIELPARVLVS